MMNDDSANVGIRHQGGNPPVLLFLPFHSVIAFELFLNSNSNINASSVIHCGVGYDNSGTYLSATGLSFAFSKAKFTLFSKIQLGFTKYLNVSEVA